MASLLLRFLRRFSRRHPAPPDGMQTSLKQPRVSALADVERAVVASNATEVERVTAQRASPYVGPVHGGEGRSDPRRPPAGG